MTFALSAHTLSFKHHSILTQLGDQIRLAESTEHGAFLTVAALQMSSRLRVELGKLPGLERFVACHRYEPYWMKPAVGAGLSQVPAETQFLLARLSGAGWLLLVPLLDEPFRFSLQGTKRGTLEILAETADAHLPGQAGVALYAAVADDPFAMMPVCATDVARRLGSGPLRRDKPLPGFIDLFGWCTWDAFYAEVSAEKVRDGLEHFRAGGVQPKMLILDDGWLDVRRMPTGETRLVSFRANDKFDGGLKPLVEYSKRAYGIQTFLVWHTIVGYWGGAARDMGYGVVDQARHFGEGILAHAPSFNNDWWGALVGFIPAEHAARFFADFHESLAAEGVDGVKVDSQAVLEAVSQGQGGRVRISRAYRKALEDSVRKHFGGRLINCMSNAQESWYFSPGSTLIRSSIDFFPKAPDSHGHHLYTNALVGLWFGEFMHPDWDMFQSGHALASFHAAGRAVSGGPVYISDKPGEHDFNLLRKLVTTDGRVLRADQPGLPSLDCLLCDPCSEPVLLKIWNRNGAGAIVGAFHCCYREAGSDAIEGSVSPLDVPGFAGERFAVFAHQAQTLGVCGRDEQRLVALNFGKFELFTFVPVIDGFAAIGLADKFNSRAAVTAEARTATGFELELVDGGHFVAYAERAPRAPSVNGKAVAFDYSVETGQLSVALSAKGPQRLLIEW